MVFAKRGILIMIVIAAFMLMPLVSAEIMTGQTNGLYSLGDRFDINIITKPSSSVNDFFISDLVCNSNNSVEIYKAPIVLGANDIKSIDISAVLDKVLIGELNGICFIRSTYGTESGDSSNFVVSNDVNVSVKMDKFVFDPEEMIKISGRAIKANGQKLDGFVDVEIVGLNKVVSGSVAGGEFAVELQVPMDVPVGKYELVAHAYEKESSGQETNSGEELTGIQINSVARSIDIAINSLSFMPGNEVVYDVLLYDQTGNAINGVNAKVTIYKTNGTLFAESLIKSGGQNSLQTLSNSTPGNWEIKAEATDVANLSVSKGFYIEYFENASFDLSNQTLSVTNTGNIPYKKSLEIAIGDTKAVKDIELEVGESKKYLLYAPDGDYNINITDGSRSASFGLAALTGNTVAVSDFSDQEKKNLTIAIWAIIILLLLILAFYAYRRAANMPYYGKMPRFLSTTPSLHIRKPVILSSITSNKSDDSDTIEKGQKQECAIVTLKIRNLDELQSVESPTIDAINAVLLKAKEQKAKIYSDGNYRIMIFSSIMTGAQDNTLAALNLAKDIEDYLRGVNRKFAKKVDFGIGVTLGHLIVEKVQGGFKFGSMGSTIPLAKKISESAHHEVLVADSMYRKVAGKVKGEKLGSYWKLNNIRNNQLHSEFIQKFLKKQNQK